MARGLGLRRARSTGRPCRSSPACATLAAQGFVTGASGRNWASYGAEVVLPPGFADADRALLTDPQTSGGLLVACGSGGGRRRCSTPSAARGFADAAVIGTVAATAGTPRLVVG